MSQIASTAFRFQAWTEDSRSTTVSWAVLWCNYRLVCVVITAVSVA